MTLSMREVLAEYIESGAEGLRLPGVAVDPGKITAVIINEVVPADPEDDFYGGHKPPEYMKTTGALFRKAGVNADTAADILQKGIYLTNAVKTPKSGYAVDADAFSAGIPVLERELSLFPNLKAVMLAGDVAKKAFNTIVKKQTGKNVIPSGSTYKLRSGAFFWGAVRVFPSYIITGGNILIEKSKVEMASDDIRRMMEVIG